MISNYVKGRVAVHIDASNIYYSQKTLKWQVDYEKLLNYFRRETTLVCISFYTAVDPEYLPQTNFLNFLRIIGYRIRSKKLKFIKTPQPSAPADGFHKGNIDGVLIADALEDADTFDTFILMSGDSDFADVIQRLKRKGKRCLVISTKNHVSKELLDEAKFIDFKKLKGEISR